MQIIALTNAEQKDEAIVECYHMESVFSNILNLASSRFIICIISTWAIAETRTRARRKMRAVLIIADGSSCRTSGSCYLFSQTSRPSLDVNNLKRSYRGSFAKIMTSLNRMKNSISRSVNVLEPIFKKKQGYSSRQTSRERTWAIGPSWECCYDLGEQSHPESWFSFDLVMRSPAWRS
jgi:hypothetical protein